jgi:Domain of unknown function (DUF4159)
MASGRLRRIAFVTGWAVLAGASLVFAQFIYRGGSGGFRGAPIRWATPDSFNGTYNFCRGYFRRNRPEPGGSGADTDYPAADNNFSVRLSELTKTPVKMDATGQPDYVVVELTDPLLFNCPMIYMEDVGTAHFSDDEVSHLRDYLLKGGFLETDDFWGTPAWEQWVREIGRVLPPAEYPIVDITPDHPLMHMMYTIKAVEQVSSIQFWRRSGGSTSERGFDSPHADFRGITDETGRLLVVMAHNTDIPDTWEREGESPEYFARFSPDGYAVGINIVLYAMTH